MIRVALISALLGGLSFCEDKAEVSGETSAAPSGLAADLHEVRLEPVGVPTLSVTAVRLRYVLPAIGGASAVEFERIEPDFQYLCETDGLKHRAKSAPNAEQIVISIASAQTAFGEIAPDVVQYFDAFDVREDTCIWGGL